MQIKRGDMAGRNRLQETETNIKEEIFKVAVKPPEKQRLSAPKTLDHLQQNFPGRVDFSVDTVRRLINDLKKRHDAPAQRHLAAGFEWHRMEEYRLPWEASQFLLEMQAWCEETYVPHAFTVHEAQWCWRVRLAAPDLGFEDTWKQAQDFVYEERHHDLLGEPLDVADLQAYLAHGEWRSEDHRNRYRRAVKEGRIPAKKNRASGALTGGGSMKARGEVIHKLKS
jgi:hypothetical protein